MRVINWFKMTSRLLNYHSRRVIYVYPSGLLHDGLSGRVDLRNRKVDNIHPLICYIDAWGSEKENKRGARRKLVGETFYPWKFKEVFNREVRFLKTIIDKRPGTFFYVERMLLPFRDDFDYNKYMRDTIRAELKDYPNVLLMWGQRKGLFTLETEDFYGKTN